MPHDTADRQAAATAALAEAGVEAGPGDTVLVIDQFGAAAGRPKLVRQVAAGPAQGGRGEEGSGR